MTLGDRVAILDNGVVQQVAPPMEVYDRPANRFVAGFIGSPAMNFFEGEVRGDEDGPTFEAGSLRLPLPSVPVGVDGPEPIVLGARPHDIRITAPEEGDVGARVDVVEPMGAQVLVHLKLGVEPGESDVRVLVPPEAAVAEGDAVGLRLRRDRLHLFARASGARLGMPSGSRQRGGATG